MTMKMVDLSHIDLLDGEHVNPDKVRRVHANGCTLRIEWDDGDDLHAHYSDEATARLARDRVVDAMRTVDGLPLIFVVVGPSGVGKSSLVASVARPPHNIGSLSEAVSHTTRDRRGNEHDGIHYHFIGRAQAQRMIDTGEFIEHATYHGNIYGLARRTVTDILDRNEDAIVVMERHGLEQMRELYGHRVKSILVVPPDLGELQRRLRKAGRNEDEIARRLETAKQEIEEGREQFDAVIINNRFEEAAHALALYIGAWRRLANR